MINSFEKSFGSEAFLKLCISNIHKILVEKKIITEEQLDDKIRLELTFDVGARAAELQAEKEKNPVEGRAIDDARLQQGMVCQIIVEDIMNFLIRETNCLNDCDDEFRHWFKGKLFGILSGKLGA
jgi:hypothetical protein